MKLLPGKLHVGIDLGSTAIKVAGIKRHGKVYVLQFCTEVDLIRACSPSAFNEIDKDVYVDQLRKLFVRYNLKKAHVSATLPTNLALIEKVEIAAEEAEGNIGLLLEERITARASTDARMIIACQELDDAGQQDDSLQLLACAVDEQLVESRKTLLAAAGLQVQSLELDAFCLFNAFRRFQLERKLDEGSGLVHIGSQYTICLFCGAGGEPFFRIIKIGGNDITKRMMSELQMDFMAAEMFKRKLFNRKWAESKAYATSLLAQIHNEFTGLLTAEIRKCMRHYQVRDAVASITRLYLSGGGANLNMLAGRVQRQLKVETSLWNPVTAFRPGQAAGSDQSVDSTFGIQFGPAIGSVTGGGRIAQN